MKIDASLAPNEWKAQIAFHVDRLFPFAAERNGRMAGHVKHPVNDFLFEYYSFRPAQLLRWSPGANILLEGASPLDIAWKEFEPIEGGLILRAESFPKHRSEYLYWARNYLTNVAERQPSFGCFGLHEWAMVYQQPIVRHSSTPLRLTPKEIADVVEADGVRCTHYDAFRFFTPEAMPLNRLHLSRKTTADHDQKGCIHVTMDLYRFAYKISPWCDAAVLGDAFLLAWEARQLDMRASPYDLLALGLKPILIETRAGREEYVEAQQKLAAKSEPIRERLIEQYSRLLQESEKKGCTQNHQQIQ
jgi:hypothetical protein